MARLSSFLLDDLRLFFSFNLIKILIYLGILVFSTICIIVRILYMDLCLNVRNLSFFLYNLMCSFREFENKSASVVNNFVKLFFLYFRYIN